MTSNYKILSAPVLDTYGYPMAVVWITGPATRMPLEIVPEFAKQVMDCAAIISNEIQNEKV